MDVENSDVAAALHAFPRQALHAWRMSLEHPVTGRPVAFEVAPPEDFERLLTDTNLR